MFRSRIARTFQLCNVDSTQFHTRL